MVFPFSLLFLLILFPSVGFVLFVLEFFVSLPVFDLFFLVFLVDLFYVSPCRFLLLMSSLGFISSDLLCHQENRHLVSVWRAPQFCFVVVLFICERSVQGKIVYFWRKCIVRLGGVGLIPSLVQIVFVSYFPTVCVMVGLIFPFISPRSSTWQYVCVWCCEFPVRSPLY